MPANAYKYCLYVRSDLAALREGFFDSEEFYGMTSDLYMYRELRTFLKSMNIDLNTQSSHFPEESDVIMCLNETDFFTNYKRTAKNKLVVLILTEPPVYNEKDWNVERHVFFDKVLTYNSDLVIKNKDKYKFLAYPIDLKGNYNPVLLSEKEFSAKKHSCLIAAAFAITEGNKKHQSLLYKRYKILKWYNTHAPEKLDYYARVHPKQKFIYFRGASWINKISRDITKKIGSYLYSKRISKVYRGSVPGLKKTETLSRYKFNFCLENSTGLNGYISEKIFDCFYSNTVPVYMGAPDINKYIPGNCYIAFSDFSDMKALNTYLENMDYETYNKYLTCAGRFLNSPEIDHFSIDKFINALYREVLL